MRTIEGFMTRHESWESGVVTPVEKTKGEYDRLLKETSEYRDFDTFPDDEEWISVCLKEGWEVFLVCIELE